MIYRIKENGFDEIRRKMIIHSNIIWWGAITKH